MNKSAPRKWEHHPLLHITLVMGAEDGFDEATIEFLSDQAGDCTESPEDLLIRIETDIENGEIDESDLQIYIEDKHR